LKFEGEVWRYIPAGAHPLNLHYVLKASGRWNRAGKYGCLYTSLSKLGARAEFDKYLIQTGLALDKVNPQEIVSIKVRVNNVLDITSRKNGYVNPDEVYLVGDETAHIEKCHKLADAARFAGFLGLLVPSAALRGEKNLIIYIDGPSKEIDLDVGNKRIAIV
jgi:RES domain-containing protein